jgi:hypothetical protein
VPQLPPFDLGPSINGGGIEVLGTVDSVELSEGQKEKAKSNHVDT